MNDRVLEVHSIAIRVQRTVVEDAYIHVPIDAVMSIAEDGSSRIDTDRLSKEAVRLSSDGGTDWQVEKSEIVPHPIQQPMPADRSPVIVDGK